MLIPEEDPNATHIMIATGTGIAPFRAYLRRFFMEDVPSFKFGGLAWLFLGVANTDSLLYHEEFSKYKEEFPDNFRSVSGIACRHPARGLPLWLQALGLELRGLETLYCC